MADDVASHIVSLDGHTDIWKTACCTNVYGEKLSIGNTVSLCVQSTKEWRDSTVGHLSKLPLVQHARVTMFVTQHPKRD